VDIVHGVFAWELTPQEWQLLGKIGKQVAWRLNQALPKERQFFVDWGGDWKFYDPAHWEIRGWQADVRKLPVLDPVRKTPRKLMQA